MSLAEKVFGKDSSKLNVSYFKKYFVNPKDESNLIEYKSYYDKRQNNHKIKSKEIVKNICAFLNSEGGLLIWGAPVESKTEDGRKFYKGELSLISEFIDKDSFYSRILNSIVPLPTGITLEILHDEKSDKQLVLFEIKESMTKPHRFDSKYYLRLDGQTLIAPHHYLKALFNQIQIPKIECYVKFDSYKYEEFKSITGYQKGGNFYCLRIELWIFNFSKYNNEENLKYRLISRNGIMYNPRISYQGQRAVYNGNHEVRDLDNIGVLHYGSPYKETLTIYYPNKLLENSTIVDEIWFIVGGKKSPLIQSKYEIKLTKKSYTNANLCIQNSKENVTLIDEIEGKNSNKIKMLKDVLNR